MAKGKDKPEFTPDEIAERRKSIVAGTDLSTKRRTRIGLADAIKELPPEIRAGTGPALDAAAFSSYSLLTPAVDLDIACGGSLSPRVELIGHPGYGKTLTAYMLAGAMQRTCRACRTPIITWIDDYSTLQTDEKKWAADPFSAEFPRKTTCLCGACEPMRLLFIDAEDQFDPIWASTWGVKVGDFEAFDKVGYEEADGEWRGLRISPDAQTVICRPSSSKLVEQTILPLMSKGAIDLVVIDSVASFAIEEDLEGTSKIASRARFMSRFCNLFLSEQIASMNKDGSKINLIATNHYMQGPVANPRQNPNKASAGLKLTYTVDQRIELTSSKINEGINEDGWKQRAFMRDISFKVVKGRGSAIMNQTGGFRVYLDDYTPNDKVTYRLGDTDEADRLIEAIKRYNDPDIFFIERGKGVGAKPGPPKAYWVLGRPFKKVRDVARFLQRDDIRFLLRFALYADTLPVAGRLALKAARFAYSPFTNDPCYKLVTKFEQKISYNLRQARSAAQERTATGPDEEKAVD